MKKVLLGSVITLVLVLTLVVGCVGGVIAAPYLQQQLAAFKIATPAPVSLGARPAFAPTPAPKLTPPPTATPVPLPADASADERTASDVYRKVSPSVVFIRVVSQPTTGGAQQRPQIPNLPQLPDLPPTGPQQASGSGFVIDQDGHILTNNHVVEGADKVEVRFIDGTTVRAKVVGTDPDSDLAVIQVDVKSSLLQPVELGDSSALIVGQQVFAIGNPFGQMWTLTSGIVSAVGRTIQSGNSRYSIPEVVQTDAAINPGNSGGPLLDKHGRVIGVNTMIISDNRSSSGVGLAVPVDIVKRVAPALIKDGKFTYAYLGLSGGALTPDLAGAMNLSPDQRGVLVGEVVKGSPSDKAGLLGSQKQVEIDGDKINVGGDVIVAADGNSVTGMDGVIDYLFTSKRPGDQITLTILRDGQQKEVVVTLGERPRQ
jgi:2-alkenal reductase